MNAMRSAYRTVVCLGGQSRAVTLYQDQIFYEGRLVGLTVKDKQTNRFKAESLDHRCVYGGKVKLTTAIALIYDLYKQGKLEG